MFSTFVFPFANFFQPGIFWPETADLRPLQLIAIFTFLASFARRPNLNRMDAFTHPALKWLFFYLAIQVISVYRSGGRAVVAEFANWSTYALFVVVSVRSISDLSSLRSYVWGMMCGSAWIIFWGIYAVHAGLMTQNGGRAGAYGMYENHNDYSFIIIQALPFFYVFWRQETGAMKRLFLLAALLASFLGIAMSLSRGAMIALVIEVMLVVWLTMSRRVRLVLVPVVLALGVAAISWQYVARAANQGNDYTAEEAESSRFELWRAGANMIEAHPFFGVGSRTFGEHSSEYEEISHDNLHKNAHNTFVEVAATSGLIGFACFVLMITRSIGELRRPADVDCPEWERHIRTAALIALLTMIFRAMFDAKPWDWSFYFLASVAAACGALWKAREASRRAAVPELVPEEPAAMSSNRHA